MMKLNSVMIKHVFLAFFMPLAAELISIMSCNVRISQIYEKKRIEFSRHLFWVLTLTDS